MNEKPLKLILADTAGQDEFDSLRPLAYPRTDIFLLAYDVSKRKSLDQIEDKWLKEVRRSRTMRQAHGLAVETSGSQRRAGPGRVSEVWGLARIATP